MKQIQFVRFGGLSPVKQLAYGKDTFHAAPARYGIYCFPETSIERFLLGKGTFDNRRMIRTTDEEHAFQVWKDAKTAKFFEEHWESMSDDELAKFRKEKSYLAKHCRPRKFSYTGNLWHHLTEFVPHKEVLKSKNSWILTSYPVWLKAFQKDFNATRPANHDGVNCSKDHLEVFIEKVN